MTSQLDAQKPETANDKPKPAATFKYRVRGGRLNVAVWGKKIEGENGAYTLYSVSISRSYYDEAEEDPKARWKETAEYMRTEDLPVLGYAIDQAWSWIQETLAQAESTYKPKPEPEEGGDY